MRNGTLLGALIVFMAANVWAQGNASPACALLTSSDLSSVGATGPAHPGELPISKGPTKGETTKMCSWRVPTGGLHLSLARMPQGVSLEAMTDELNKTYATLKAQGWTEEKKDFGRIKCELLTPPPGKQDFPSTTSCFTAAKGMMVSVATLSKTRIPMEKVKALVDSATARLP